MDVTFILSAVVFTLFAIVVATALFAKSSTNVVGSKPTTRDSSRTPGGGFIIDRPVHNDDLPGGQKKQAVEDCTALSTAARSAPQHHLSEESLPEPHAEELGTAPTTVEQSTSSTHPSGHEPACSLDAEELGTTATTAATVEQSTSSTHPSGHEPASSLDAEELGTTTATTAATVEQSTSSTHPYGHEPACSLDMVDWLSTWLSAAWPSPGTGRGHRSPGTGRGHRSYIGLSDTELLKCAFSSSPSSQADGPPESLGILDDTDFKYAPGAVRTQQMQSMMSEDELEEERRVQREQLAAIFRLLKDNQETFGEVSEGDMEQQLKLYSI